MVDSLWGEEFKIEDTPAKTKKIIKKINSEKKASVELDAEKAVKSKKLSVDDKLVIVKQKVLETLGKQIENVVVLRTKEELHQYINKGLEIGRIAIDTETNNSLDPITCKLMGLCLYVKGEKQAYIPINHINKEIGVRLENQLNEKDIEDELNYLITNKGNCKFIFHNGKFDYEVLKCTCNVEVPVDWDTMIGAKLLDENEQSAGLKWQYINKIDPEQSKYDIENLFEKLPYEVVDPDLFALYAATDAMMTDKLYEWQMEKFKAPNLKDVLNLALTLEMPLVKVFAWMELNGVEFDSEYQKLLSAKYHKILDEVDAELQTEINHLQPQIDAWRLTEEANKKTITNAGKEGKSKNEQLTTPINLSSPTQLAILLYDVLKVKPVSTKTPRGTGSDILEKINQPICKYLVKRKELEKLISGFIDALPDYVNVDGRIHCHFNQLGAATGRQSCIAKGTLVSMPGGDKPIDEVKPGEYVYCYDENNKLRLGKVIHSWYTGNRKVIKINWRSKYNHELTGSLVCTPDHFIKTSNKGWVEAQDLKIEDSILYVHRGVNKNSVSLYANFGQGDEEEHAWVKREYFKADPDLDIHHIDHNRLNNSPLNLVCVSKKTHANIHNFDNTNDGVNRNNFYSFSYDDLIKMGDSVCWELTKLPYDYSSLKSWFENYRINYIEKYTQSYSKRSYKKSKYGTPMKNLHLPLNKSNLLYALDLANGDISKVASYFGVSVNTIEDNCNKYELLSNHNITSIEYLDDTWDVYDLEVENYHNFIAGELCVHNCTEPNLQQIPSGDKSIRMLFKSSEKIIDRYSEEDNDDCFRLKNYEYVNTPNGYLCVTNMKVDDYILVDNHPQQIKVIKKEMDTYYIYI